MEQAAKEKCVARGSPADTKDPSEEDFGQPIHSSLKNDNGGAPRKKCTGNEDDCGPFCGLVQMTPDKSCIRSRLHTPQNSGIPMQATSKNDTVAFKDLATKNGR